MRKGQKKSRTGCGACKRRRVKVGSRSRSGLRGEAFSSVEDTRKGNGEAIGFLETTAPTNFVVGSVTSKVLLVRLARFETLSVILLLHELLEVQTDSTSPMELHQSRFKPPTYRQHHKAVKSIQITALLPGTLFLRGKEFSNYRT